MNHIRLAIQMYENLVEISMEKITNLKKNGRAGQKDKKEDLKTEEENFSKMHIPAPNRVNRNVPIFATF